MVKGFKKKNGKGGHDFIPTDKGTTRDLSGTPDTEINIEVDNNSDDFAESKRREVDDDTRSLWDSMSDEKKYSLFHRMAMSGTHFDEDNEENWKKYQYGNVKNWDELPFSMQDYLRKRPPMYFESYLT